MHARLYGLLLASVLIPLSAYGEQPLTEAEAVAKVALLGGKIEREPAAPNSAAEEPPGVVGIDFGGSQRLGDGFLFLLRAFPKLKRLELDDTRVTAAGLRQLGDLTLLEELSLRNLGIDDEAVGDLKAHKELRELDLSGTKVTEEGREALREALPELWIVDEAESIRTFEGIEGIFERHVDRPGRPVRSLEFRMRHELTARHRRLLRAFKHLEELDLELRSEIPAAAFRELERFPELTRLQLGYTGIDDDGLQSVGKLTRLKSLRLLGCQRISDAGLRELRNLQGVVDLNLYWCPRITDAGLAELTALKSLERLSLGEQKITEVGIAHLAALPALMDLSLSNCPEITDRAAKELGKLSGLRSLDLWRAKVTDAGVRELGTLTELKGLGLGGTGVTAIGLRELRPLNKLSGLTLAETRLTPEGSCT